MKKYIILSVNSNEDYMFFAPLVFWAWRRFGWEPILFYHQAGRNYDSTGNRTVISFLEELIDKNGVGSPMFLKDIDGYRSDTITQVSRLYGSEVPHIQAYDYLMTGDIDMLPLSNYWNPSFSAITVWGHDLTGFGHYPICYIGMDASRWHSVMKLYDFDLRNPKGGVSQSIKEDLDKLPQAKDPDFYKYWFTDQDLITQRLNEFGKDKLTVINRGQGAHGYARGRVDRAPGGWRFDLPELIDAHLEQQTHHDEKKIARLLNLLSHVWPNEDWSWFRKYTNDFREITGRERLNWL